MSCGLQDVLEFEALGRPAVLVASGAFTDAAERQAALLGQPALRARLRRAPGPGPHRRRDAGARARRGGRAAACSSRQRRGAPWRRAGPGLRSAAWSARDALVRRGGGALLRVRVWDRRGLRELLAARAAGQARVPRRRRVHQLRRARRAGARARDEMASAASARARSSRCGWATRSTTWSSAYALAAAGAVLFELPPDATPPQVDGRAAPDRGGRVLQRRRDSAELAVPRRPHRSGASPGGHRRGLAPHRHLRHHRDAEDRDAHDQRLDGDGAHVLSRTGIGRDESR